MNGWHAGRFRASAAEGYAVALSLRSSGRPPDRLLAAALDRGADAQRLAIFGDGPPGDVEALAFEQVDELVVGQDSMRILGAGQRPDPALHRLGRDGVAASAALDAAGEEIF